MTSPGHRPADSLGNHWNAEAGRWIAWARTPGHDSYWQFHRDAFLPLATGCADLAVAFMSLPDVDALAEAAMTFHSEHRPLEAYTEALARAGFVIERLREPTEPAPGSPWRRVPMFLHIVAWLRAEPGDQPGG